MNIYKLLHAPFVNNGRHAPQVTIYQIALMLAHQRHIEERDQAGKYKWYDESLITVSQFVRSIIETARIHAPRGQETTMMVVGTKEFEMADWPIEGAIAVRATNDLNVHIGDKCRAYQKALNEYWLDIETGAHPDHPAPDLKDYLYPPLGV